MSAIALAKAEASPPFQGGVPRDSGGRWLEYMSKRLNNLIGLKANRKDLRKNFTPAEAKLWSCLQNSQLGEKFRRQYSIDYYILDFYCPKKKLAIELDGSPHNTEQGFIKDKERTKFLNNKGIKVIRFENKDVINNIEGVLEEIKKYLY